MSDFIRYQHVERLGTQATDGILEGKCYIFYKLDGTNASVWSDGFPEDHYHIHCGSRNRELQLGNDNAGFMNWVYTKEQYTKYDDFFLNNPKLRLYGEWLVPHTLKTYTDEAWKRFYVFDIVDTTTGEALPYEAVKDLCEEFGLDYVPVLAIINNPSEEDIIRCLDKSGQFLVRDGAGKGEGVVVKNYEYYNRYGNQVWAKLVTNEFKIANHKEFGPQVINSTALVEEQIVTNFLTDAFILKEQSKIVVTKGEEWSNKFIPELLGRVWYEFIREETFEWVRKYKNPKVNFGLLNNLVIRKTKEVIGL